MKHSIGALSRLSGVSVRALHHYDQIGLLHPCEVAKSGYRYYDGANVERLWQILFYRELGFSLRDIKTILSSPDFDRVRALEEHQTLLLQKRKRLDGLIERGTEYGVSTI
jgi:DNA-binding transcriptional MerR regulator